MAQDKGQRKKKISRRTAIKKDKRSKKLVHQHEEKDVLTVPPDDCFECRKENGDLILYVCCNRADGSTRFAVQDPLLLEGIIDWVHEHEPDDGDFMDGPDEDELIVDSGCPG